MSKESICTVVGMWMAIVGIVFGMYNTDKGSPHATSQDYSKYSIAYFNEQDKKTENIVDTICNNSQSVASKYLNCDDVKKENIVESVKNYIPIKVTIEYNK